MTCGTGLGREQKETMQAHRDMAMPKLGFGLMRLPRKWGTIDVEQVKEMVDLFMGAGFTYFDTAFVYKGSEEAAREALVERYPRDSYSLASKLSARAMKDAEGAKSEFDISLERTQAERFDFYLLHGLGQGERTTIYDDYGIWDFARQKKEEGLIGHLGFSFHAGPDLLRSILDKHGDDVDFVQLQLNYADWENPNVMSRANYEVAREYGKPIIVMEPLKGGRLAKPPLEAAKLFEEAAPKATCASWAIRYAASLEGVMTVLSGMSNVRQMKDNISYMREFKPLDEAELKIIARVQKIIAESDEIPCTACGYCLDDCPRGIAIPKIFEAMNLWRGDSFVGKAIRTYKEAIAEGGRARDCIECRRCERACTQNIDVVYLLKECAAAFDYNE